MLAEERPPAKKAEIVLFLPLAAVNTMSTTTPSMRDIRNTKMPWKLPKKSSTNPFRAPVIVPEPVFLTIIADRTSQRTWSPDKA